MSQCRLPEEMGRYISFRIRKDLDIEPETIPAKGGSLPHEIRHCVCGCGEDDDETMTAEKEYEEEFLSAYEVENWEDSSESENKSSASSFAFPVLDARWSGSPVQMPKPNKKLAAFLKKPKRIVCRWCTSF